MFDQFEPSAVLTRLAWEELERRYGSARNYTDACRARYEAVGNGPNFEEDTPKQWWSRLQRKAANGEVATRDMLRKTMGILTEAELDGFWRRIQLATPTEKLLKNMRTAFAAEELQTERMIDHHGGLLHTAYFVGSILQVRNFFLHPETAAERGVPLRAVDLVNTHREFLAPQALRIGRMAQGVTSGKKYVLSDIDPPDLFDAWSGRVTLQVEETSYQSVIESDPSTANEFAGNKDLDNNDEVVKLRASLSPFANRLEWGRPAPSMSQVPYSVTLFFTILLADNSVLALRRTNTTQWYPNSIELSGGEGLSPQDFDEDGSQFSVMEQWLMRGVGQEFLPTRGLSRYNRRVCAEQLKIAGKLYAIGYAEMDCSFPIFVVARSALDRKGYLDVVHKQLSDRPGSEFDKEGTIGIFTPEEIYDLLVRGATEGKLLCTRGKGQKQTVFLNPVSSDSAMRVRLNPKDLHPMTPFRLKLALDALSSG
jgi:hypothetical protein